MSKRKICPKCGKEYIYRCRYRCVDCYNEERREHFKQSAEARQRNNTRSKRYYEENKDRIRAKRHHNRKRWEEELQARLGTPYCDVCRMELSWFSQRGESSVHWDHRHGQDGYRPSDAFERKFSLERLDLFLGRDYGRLCAQCNRSLPTDPEDRNRILDHLDSLVQYVRR